MRGATAAGGKPPGRAYQLGTGGDPTVGAADPLSQQTDSSASRLECTERKVMNVALARHSRLVMCILDWRPPVDSFPGMVRQCVCHMSDSAPTRR